jgi:hypothetical protein
MPRLLEDDGRPADATFLVERSGSGITMVMESRGGRQSRADTRNPEYGKGLELLLRRLRDRGARIEDALVESVATRRLSAEERRLAVEGRAYPIEIDDPVDLQKRLGAAQSRVGRKAGAKGSGNRTKRLRLHLGFPGSVPQAAVLEAELAGNSEGGYGASGRRSTREGKADVQGPPYRNQGKLARATRIDPFEIDPDKVDRGNQAHATTQDSLADHVRERGLVPRSPRSGQPEFDLLWNSADRTFVAEVKSITSSNEEKQLRLGLGQVLRYRHALSTPGREVVAVLVLESQPRDESWVDLCSSLGVKLVWPKAFDRLD